MDLSNPVDPEELTKVYKLMSVGPEATIEYIKYLNRVDKKLWTPKALCNEFKLTKGVIDNIVYQRRITERRIKDRRRKQRRNE